MGGSAEHAHQGNDGDFEGLSTITVAGTPLQVIVSCNSMWLFDDRRRRFRRVPRGTNIEIPSPESEWETYTDLELDLDSPEFVVVLNDSGTRLLHSTRHLDPCPNCDGPRGEEELTAEPRLDEVRARAQQP